MPVVTSNEVLGFSADQVSRLTELSPRQLRYWDDTEFFSPAFREDARRSPWARVYSFRDVVGLRAISEMRKHHHVPLQRLRRVGAELREQYDKPWSSLTFYMVGKQVFFQDAEQAAITRADHTRQALMPYALVRVEHEVIEKLREMRQRKDEQVGKITRNRHVAENQPVLEGTRIPTVAIWEFHQAGHTQQSILRAYPQLRASDLDAALDYEAKRPKRARQQQLKAS